jgi:hypothetical protein
VLSAMRRRRSAARPDEVSGIPLLSPIKRRAQAQRPPPPLLGEREIRG